MYSRELVKYIGSVCYYCNSRVVTKYFNRYLILKELKITEMVLKMLTRILCNWFVILVVASEQLSISRIGAHSKL